MHVVPLPNRWAKLGNYSDQINKYLTACYDERISDDFIASNDDFFIMKTWKPTIYNRGTLEEHMRWRGRNDVYQKSLQATKDYLEKNGYETLSFELHIPFVYNKRLLKQLIESLPQDPRKQLQIRSLYGNIYKVDSEYMTDVKNPKDYQGMTLLSTNEKTFRLDLGMYIQRNLS